MRTTVAKSGVALKEKDGETMVSQVKKRTKFRIS